LTPTWESKNREYLKVTTPVSVWKYVPFDYYGIPEGSVRSEMKNQAIFSTGEQYFSQG
jgi:hypothetical protein